MAEIAISEEQDLKQRIHEIERELVEKPIKTDKQEEEKLWLETKLRELRTRLKVLEEEKALVTAQTIARTLWKSTSILGEGHVFAADTWGGYHLGLGILATILSATVGASIFSDSENLAVVAGILSLALVVVSALATFLNPEQRSASHYKSGTSFRVLANKAQVLVDIEMALRNKPVSDLADELKKLTDERDELMGNSPRVPHRHRVRAGKLFETEAQELIKRMTEQILKLPEELESAPIEA